MRLLVVHASILYLCLNIAEGKRRHLRQYDGSLENDEYFSDEYFSDEYISGEYFSGEYEDHSVEMSGRGFITHAIKGAVHNIGDMGNSMAGKVKGGLGIEDEEDEIEGPYAGEAAGKPCILKTYGTFKIVCVCNETYCDDMSEATLPKKGNFMLYISDRAGGRFRKFEYPFGKETIHGEGKRTIELGVDKKLKAQKIYGFGGTFTDSAAFNIDKLSEDMKEMAIKSYYGTEGIGYTLARIPMGGSDFSKRPYTYDDLGVGKNLSSWALQEEDIQLKIPLLQAAKKNCPSLRMYGSPWTAPPWMKTNSISKGKGSLKTEYYQLWADYFIKFMKAYEKEGLPMWGITTQNQPIDRNKLLDNEIPFFPYNSMGWEAENHHKWVKKHLAPILHKEGYKKLKLMVFDDSAGYLASWAETFLGDSVSYNMVSGLAVQWYFHDANRYSIINQTAAKYPYHFILGTEACHGYLPNENRVDIGSWERGEEYAEDITKLLLNGGSGWTDWNLMLDLKGGPNHAGFGADAPMLLEDNAKQFYKQPMFYALAHFAKFMVPGSFALTTSTNLLSKGMLSRVTDTVFQTILRKLHILAAIRPDGFVVVTFCNTNEDRIQIDIADKDLKKERLSFSVGPRSWTTLIYES